MACLCALTMYDTYNDKVTVESSRGLTHAGSITYLAEAGIDNTKSCFLQHDFVYCELEYSDLCGQFKDTTFL